MSKPNPKQHGPLHWKSQLRHITVGDYMAIIKLPEQQQVLLTVNADRAYKRAVISALNRIADALEMGYEDEAEEPQPGLPAGSLPLVIKQP